MNTNYTDQLKKCYTCVNTYYTDQLKKLEELVAQPHCIHVYVELQLNMFKLTEEVLHICEYKLFWSNLFSSTNIQIQTILINFTSATHIVNINFDKVNKTLVTISIYMKCSHIHTLL